MKKIIISGINLFSGGPLSIIRDCLSYLKTRDDIEVVALVHDKKLFSEFLNCNNIKFLEFQDSRKNWFRRLYYEYFYFKGLSKQIKPDLWLSLHDMTPNVEAKVRAVYCHNSSPFYKMSRLEKKLDFKLRLFNLFYKYLYKINIKQNNFVIVQQNWLKEKFEKIYGISNVIVSYPNIDLKAIDYKKIEKNSSKISFFYPAFPRVFKNFEIICEAAKSFEEKGVNNLEFILTIEKGMNK
ncbi:MAG: glycosyltransferase, partial [Fusobacteriaceae bacterium]